MDKVCRIISKSRRLYALWWRSLTAAPPKPLHSSTRPRGPNWSCTTVLVSDYRCAIDVDLVQSSYMALSNLCPNLERLSLHLCGQISTDTLIAWAESLTKLRHIELVAPFLVRKQGWIEFFRLRRLKSLLVTQSPRIDLEVVEALVQYCPDITDLRLSQIGQMSDVLLQPLAALSRLTSLNLSSPGSPLSDRAVAELLETAGSNLVHLDLSGTELSDDVLPAIAKHCIVLRSLSLRHLGDLSDDAVGRMFNTMGNLERVDLEKCHQLREKALNALIDHSKSAIESIKIPGWKDVPAEALGRMAECKVLKEVDMGWCRQVTDYTVKEILDGCEQLEVLRVWGEFTDALPTEQSDRIGCNQLTDAVPRKRGVKVIGIETHAI